MRAVFYGFEPGVGTSANMQLALCQAMFRPDLRDGIRNGQLQFIDCGMVDQKERKKQICDADLLVLNLSFHHFWLENFYLNLSNVHKNIIFLIGKYYQNKKTELQQLSRWYRIPEERICTIPYNQRFKQAYEEGKLPSYLKWQCGESSYENLVFQESTKRLLDTIVRCKNRKGDIYYG